MNILKGNLFLSKEEKITIFNANFNYIAIDRLLEEELDI